MYERMYIYIRLILTKSLVVLSTIEVQIDFGLLYMLPYYEQNSFRVLIGIL